MVEVAIASAVMLVILTALARVVTGSLVDVGFAKQRQAATSLMAKTMEQVRALPFQTLASGLDNADSTVTSDSNITVSGQTWTYTATSEVIPHGAHGGTTLTPLTPHQTTNASSNGTTYTISVYPTVYTPAAGSYRVTVVVSWTPTLRNGVVSQVSSQTIVYSPSNGCLSTANHPFAAPCQPFFHAATTDGSGAIKITGGSGYTGQPIAGIPLNSAQLFPVRNETTMSIEQTSTLLGTINTAGASLDVAGQTLQQTGQVAGSANADNDPDTVNNVSNPSSIVQAGTAITYSAGSGANSITLTPSNSDSGSGAATVNAGASPACNDLAGVSIQSALPCSSGTVGQSGATALSAVANLYSGAAALGNAPLASIAAQPSATQTRAFTSRLTTATGGYCTGTSGDGCVHAGAQRAFGTVALAGLPANIAGPSGWANASCGNTNALVQLTNFADTASSESGISAANPSVTQTGGTLKYWNGNGCTSVNVNWGGSPPSITIPTVTVNSGLGSGTTVTITATLTLRGTSTSKTTPAGCVSVCTGTATSSSPIVGDISYVVTNGEVTVANLDINVNLGDLLVTTAYQAAPT